MSAPWLLLSCDGEDGEDEGDDGKPFQGRHGVAVLRNPWSSYYSTLRIFLIFTRQIFYIFQPGGWQHFQLWQVLLLPPSCLSSSCKKLKSLSEWRSLVERGGSKPKVGQQIRQRKGALQSQRQKRAKNICWGAIKVTWERRGCLRAPSCFSSACSSPLLTGPGCNRVLVDSTNQLKKVQNIHWVKMSRKTRALIQKVQEVQVKMAYQKYLLCLQFQESQGATSEDILRISW